MFLLAILEFRCIECFAYALASLVLIYFYVCTRTPALLYPISFFLCTVFLELLFCLVLPTVARPCYRLFCLPLPLLR